MGILNRLKKLISHQEELMEPQEEKKGETFNIYEELGIITPFTVLADKQFKSFIAALSSNKNGILNDAEKGAFHELWSTAGVDFCGYGNNIWNLYEGCFEIYNKDGVIVRYEKKKAEARPKYEDSYDDGRANFVYLSKDGNFIINQNERNKKVFLVYVSEDISDRLLRALSEAEAEVLDLSLESIQTRERLGIPKSLDVTNIKTETIQEKYRVNIEDKHYNDSTRIHTDLENDENGER